MKKILLFIIVLFASCDITYEHKIPGTKYTLYKDDLLTLVREPPTNESIGWEFLHVAGVYYNDEYIVGFQCGLVDVYGFFIIHLNVLPDGQDEQMTFDCKESYISARDSLGIKEKDMRLIRLR